MTPEIIRVLEEIGWSHVLRVSPLFAFSRINVLDPEGGALAKRRPEAEEVAANLKNAFESAFDAWTKFAQPQVGDGETLVEIQKTRQLFEILPPKIKKRINLAAEALDKLEAGCSNIAVWGPPVIEIQFDSESDLWRAMAGMEATLHCLESETSPARRGRPRNEYAYRIAKAISEIYVVGTGEFPTYGNRGDINGPSGLFCRTTKAVLKALNLPDHETVPLCKRAVKCMTELEFETLLKLRDPNRAGDVHLLLTKAPTDG